VKGIIPDFASYFNGKLSDFGIFAPRLPPPGPTFSAAGFFAKSP
jgi:hypothetical protein